MEEGYIYCFSNPAFIKNIYKVGYTTNSPLERCDQLYTTGVPLPFKLEFAKKVKNPKEKEISLHELLSHFGERINLNREFFKMELNNIKRLFDLIEGEYFEIPDDALSSTSENKVKGCRDMTKCFKDGQKIKHAIGKDAFCDIWIATYENKNIVLDEDKTKIFKSLSAFSGAHYARSRPDRTNNSNGWAECECMLDNGEWISTNDLKEII